MSPEEKIRQLALISGKRDELNAHRRSLYVDQETIRRELKRLHDEVEQLDTQERELLRGR